MKRRTKVIMVIVAGLLVIAGIFGATTAFADNSSSGTSSGNSTTPLNTLLQQVASNYQSITGQSLNITALEQAFQQAQTQVQQNAVKTFLDKLVQKGVITQDQENQYLSWLNSRPNVPQLNGRGGFFGRMFGAQGLGHTFSFFRHPGQTQGQTQNQNQSSTNQAPLPQPTF